MEKGANIGLTHIGEFKKKTRDIKKRKKTRDLRGFWRELSQIYCDASGFNVIPRGPLMVPSSLRS